MGVASLPSSSRERGRKIFRTSAGKDFSCTGKEEEGRGGRGVHRRRHRDGRRRRVLLQVGEVAAAEAAAAAAAGGKAEVMC